ncbi:MAG: radical SAM protein [Patescibacteria group bacterium]
MKIIFINPPVKNLITANVPMVVEEGGRGALPPLGILYVAAYLKKYTSNEIKILDLELESKSDEEIGDYLLKEKPQVVGITLISFLLIDVINLISLIRRFLPEVKIIAGGPHACIYPVETLNSLHVDYVVLGEGELPCFDLISNLDDLEKLKKVRGLVFKDGEEIINTGPRELIQDLDSLPFPARELTEYKKYYSTLALANPTTTMFTSRGCPYQCVFCDRPHLGKFFRARSAKNVVDEMEEVVGLGIKEIYIYDDTFTIDRQRVVDICEEILRRNLKIYWDVRARVNTVDEELLKLMKKAGCSRIHYGVESGVDRVLENLRKGITVEMVRRAFKMTKIVGIETAAYFMVGCPGETMDDIKKSVELAKELKPAYVHFSVFSIYPATDAYLRALKAGLVKKDVWQEFAAAPSADFKPPLWEENFSREQLIEILNQAYRSFYLRPSYVFKKLVEIKSFSDLWHKARIGLKIFRI